MIDFEALVLERSKYMPVMVEFSAPSCGPCVWMEKTLIQLTREMDGKIEFVSIPIHKMPESEVTYNLKSNPTTILFLSGREVGRLNGALPKIVIEQWINDYINPSLNK